MRNWGALALALSMAGCHLLLGLDDYYQAPECPAGAALCVVCKDAADCGPAEACHTWNCVGHLCQPINAVAGTSCQEGVCSDESPSTCVECNQDADCGAGGYCYERACFRCDNGVKEADETDVDCGGAHCTKCVQGKVCGTGADCTTTFCVDGVCCGDACGEACWSCSIPGNVGECSVIERYGEDPSYGMGEACLVEDGRACQGFGVCLNALGVECTGNVDCASTKCADPDMDGTKTCLKDMGESCASYTECYNHICASGVCQ